MEWINLKDEQPKDRQRCIFWYIPHKEAYFGTFYATAKIGPCFDSGGVCAMVPGDALYWMPEPKGPEGV